jgi:hypothetical protein
MAKRIALVVFLLIVEFGIHGWAQVVPKPQPAPDGIVSGSDIGFRVEHTEGNTALGTFMVRVNGKWVEAQVSGHRGVVPLRTP